MITGASSGIGADYARQLAARGYGLVLVARRAHRLADLAEELRTAHAAPAIETLVADLADPTDLATVRQRVAQDDVALLVNNAGINGYGPFAEADPDVVAQVIQLNVTAPTLLARTAVASISQRGGAVVNVASLLAFAGSLPPGPLPHRAVYAATKGYLVTFSRTLAAELLDTPVRVQVICPGYTSTEFHMAEGLRPVADGARDVVTGSGHAMPSIDVVRASLAALESGEVVCVPGLTDPAAVQRLVDAELGIRTASSSELAPRYRR